MRYEYCGASWELQLAHVIRSERTTEGYRETVQCPSCGHVEMALKPDMGECNGD